MGRRSRRALLRGAAGVVGAVAGCLGPLGGTDTTGTYLDWLPAPGAAGADSYAAAHVDAAVLRSRLSALHPAARFLVRRRLLPEGSYLTGLVGRAGELVWFSPAVGEVVVRLAPDVDDPAAELSDAGYERDGERGEFATFSHGNNPELPGWAPRLVAVGHDAVVHTPAADPLPVARSEFEAVLDARRGERQRYHEASDAVEHVTTGLEDRTVTRLSTRGEDQPFGTVVAGARGWRVGERRTDFRWLLRFEDAADADVTDVEGGLRASLADYEDRSVTRDGRDVEATGSIPTGRFDLGYPGTPGEDGIRRAEFSIDWLGSTVEVTHTGGQPIRADRLQVAIDGRPTDTQFRDRYELVDEGDAITVELDAGREVTVVWRHPEGGEPVTLAWTIIAS